MKKPRLTCESALLLAHRRIALLEARVDALSGGCRPPCKCPAPHPHPVRPPDELARALWTSAILIVSVVLVMVALMYWGTQV